MHPAGFSCSVKFTVPNTFDGKSSTICVVLTVPPPSAGRFGQPTSDFVDIFSWEAVPEIAKKPPRRLKSSLRDVGQFHATVHRDEERAARSGVLFSGIWSLPPIADVGQRQIRLAARETQ
ncbi:hypothetical protein BIW11_02847 [Tropilaelaps mercedesae]|uniref:Uncharacterized protein n=1 Tax=Tropilaelaps mercedesae TaxID=418985 RepID=A0A1V9XWM6_9ACAR|nr:hypothetical protein BIW11_02847 [Tropilaelaps mercedesae]